MPPPGAGPGGLQLLGEIARGGIGTVLKGRDPDLSRDLAVKVLLDRHRDDPDLLRRFVEEAQIAGQLQHPGIVPVYRLGMLADRRPYFTMKLVKGRTLAALLADREPRPRPRRRGRGRRRGDRRPPYDDLPRFIAIFEQVCRTVAYAHTRGVIHRDLKPSNIMVGGFGEVQVMDWGLAKVLARGEPAPPPDEPRAPADGRSSPRRGAGAARTARTCPRRLGHRHARLHGPRAGPRRGPPRSTPAPTSSPSARSCARPSPAARRTPAGGPPRCAAWRRGATRPRPWRRSTAAAATPSWSPSPATAWPPNPRADCRTPAPSPTASPPTWPAWASGCGGAELDGAAESARAAAAEAAAAVERRARRLTIGLAAAVLLLIGTAGGGYAWLERDRAARRATTERAVAAGLDRAHALHAEALAAPADRPGPWNEAMAAARGAEGRLRRGDAGPALAARVATAIAEIGRDGAAAEARAARIAADRTLLAELESVRGGRADHGDAKQTDAEYAAAFRKAGLDLDAVAPERAGEWIAARTAPLELAAFLDDWAAVRQLAEAGEPAWRRPADAARAADKDPWRDALRAGRGDKGPAALAALRKLAGDGAELDAQPAEGLRLLAMRLRAAGDREAAARVLAGAWRKRPDDFWVHLDLAQARGPESGEAAALYPRPEEAVRHLTAALAVRPRSAVAHHGLGVALQSQGKVDEAVAALREAIRIRPDYAQAHNSLGVALESQGKPDEAVAALREAIRLRPDYAEAHNNLGGALTDQGKRDEAVAEYREAIRLKPDIAEAHNSLGKALQSRGKRDEAVAEYREAIRIRPDYAEAHNSLANALAGQGKPDEAVAELREAIRLKPDLAMAHNNLGVVLLSQGKVDEAVAADREAIRLKPDYALAHTNLANALSSQGKVDEAIAEYREAIRLRPDEAEPHCNLGQALRGRGDYAEVARDVPPRARAGQQAARLALSLGAVGRGGRADGGAGPAATRPAQGRGSSQGHRRAA